MNLNRLEEILATEPKYRLKQAKEAVFEELIGDWQEAAALPLALRGKLNDQCSLAIQTEKLVAQTGDSTKAKITLEDGIQIESVLMHHRDGRNTVCVSSQAGCPLGCEFCATGKMGFKRNLAPLEIIEQLIFFARGLKKEKERITNVVFMGMGEPFLNYENVLAAARIINDKEGLNIGARHISISTVGLTEGIKKLSEEKPQLNLAISLHASNNQLRSKIMPINQKYPLAEIFKAVDAYIAKTKRKVMFEYLLIKGVNDSNAAAAELAELVKKPLYFLNLILYNPTGIFKPSSSERVREFKNILKRENVNFSQRYRFGRDIKAACGQFVGGRLKK